MRLYSQPFILNTYSTSLGVGFTNSPLKVRRPATPDLAGGYTPITLHLVRGVRSLPQFLQLTQQQYAHTRATTTLLQIFSR